jgi:hypothetical protein
VEDAVMTVAGLGQLLGVLSVMTYAVVTPASIDTSDGRDVATARVVSSIVSYTRWPERPARIQLCVVGPAAYADRFNTVTLAGGPAVNVVQVAPARVAASQCNVLYFGQLSPGQLREQTDWARGRAILTIAEADAGCRAQAMFCLQYEDSGLTFDLNVDAVSRSGLRVDPRVLRLAGEGSS